MADYPNFYESLPEAQYRLRNTIVVYDHDKEPEGEKKGIEPYTVLAITNHKKDGIFRIYLMPLSNYGDTGGANIPNWPRVHDFHEGSAELGEYLDKWMTNHSKVGVLRKTMNSPAFNRFRPFPLGMWHMRDYTYYLARQPQRHREQGLTRAAVACHKVTLGSNQQGPGFPYQLGGPALRDTIKGDYPSIKECLEHMRNPDEREAVGFHRDFAIVRGPLGLIFLVYRTDVIGFIPDTREPEALLDSNFGYLKECVENTNSFVSVKVKEK